MNYIAEIKAFYEFAELNLLSSQEICLWHALMYINNKTMWQKEFSVPISVLEIKTGMKKKAIINARNNLKSWGLIDFKSRNGNQSAIYSIIPFVVLTETQTGTQVGTQTGTQTGTQVGTQTGTINKHKHKLNINEKKKNIKKEIASETVLDDGDDGFQTVLDELVENDELKKALREYINMRMAHRDSRFTDYAFLLLVKKLQTLSQNTNEQIRIVNQSIINGWKDFYKLQLQKGEQDGNRNNQETRDYEKIVESFTDEDYAELERRLCNEGNDFFK